jgi:ABC-type Fe3+ transport system permease subunit
MMPGIFSGFAAACGGGSFLGFPHWYEYLQCQTISIKGQPTTYAPQLTKLTDVWLIVAAVVEILLRIGALAAVVFVIYGGFQYMTSQGEPDKTSHARDTIVNALIGLTISVMAAAIVGFVAGRFN